jgi:antitoxin component YwqK of YwqJK toxin-antitoxin module
MSSSPVEHVTVEHVTVEHVTAVVKQPTEAAIRFAALREQQRKRRELKFARLAAEDAAADEANERYPGQKKWERAKQLATELYSEYFKGDGKFYMYRDNRFMIIFLAVSPKDVVCYCEIEPKKYWSDNLEIVLIYNIDDPYKLVLNTGNYKIGSAPVKSFCYKTIEDAYRLIQGYLDDGVTKECEVHYSPHSNMILEGMFHRWYKGGQMSQERTYINDVEVGSSRNWYSTGRLASEEFYIDGKIHGLNRAWYKNGQIEYEKHYVNGKLDGLTQYWHKTGQIISVSHYINGVKNGLSQAWYKSGQLMNETMYDNGVRISDKWWTKTGEVATYDDSYYRRYDSSSSSSSDDDW